MPQTQWSQMGRWHAWQYFQYSQRHLADNCSQTGFLCSVKIYWIFQLQGHLKSITKKNLLLFYFTRQRGMLPTLCLLKRNQLKHASSGLSLTQILQSPSYIWLRLWWRKAIFVRQLIWLSWWKNSINILQVIHQYLSIQSQEGNATQ